jgi:hypothetical protein
MAATGVRSMWGIRIGVAAAGLAGAALVGVGPASGGESKQAETPVPEPAMAVEPVTPAALPADPEPTPVQDPTVTPIIERPVVVLYGDSLAWEAHEYFTAAFAGHPHVEVVTRTYGGTAICDWFEAMRADAAALVPGAVVIEFSGNNLTACMQDPTGEVLNGDAHLERYRLDAEAVVEIFEPIGAHVYFVSAPNPRPTVDTGDFKGGRLNAMYAEVAGSHPAVATFVDAGAAVLDRGEWTSTLPCLPDEPCEGGADGHGRGVNVVRAPDGPHFCPTGEEAPVGVTSTCVVWSSGAYRFASAMASAVIAALGV